MKKSDFIVIGAVSVIVGILLVCLYVFGGESGKYVQVESNGNVIDTLKLDEDIQKEYAFGDETNTLKIENGKATVTSANCPDGICVNHKAIYRKGESIICLPHKLVITIIGDSPTDDEIDAVA